MNGTTVDFARDINRLNTSGKFAQDILDGIADPMDDSAAGIEHPRIVDGIARAGDRAMKLVAGFAAIVEGLVMKRAGPLNDLRTTRAAEGTKDAFMRAERNLEPVAEAKLPASPVRIAP